MLQHSPPPTLNDESSVRHLAPRSLVGSPEKRRAVRLPAAVAAVRERRAERPSAAGCLPLPGRKWRARRVGYRWRGRSVSSSLRRLSTS